jgi:hypothetical protein
MSVTRKIPTNFPGENDPNTPSPVPHEPGNARMGPGVNYPGGTHAATISKPGYRPRFVGAAADSRSDTDRTRPDSER